MEAPIPLCSAVFTSQSWSLKKCLTPQKTFMPRVLISPHAIHGDSITITDDGTLHHLLHVLRVSVGDRLECFDGHGRIYTGSVIRRARRELTLTIDRTIEESPAPVAITLAQALIKPERFEWAIQKATELGIARLVPMVTSRTAVRLRAQRLARWQRIAEEASSQCGRATVPIIEEPQTFARVLERRRGCLAILFTLLDGSPLEEHLPDLKGACEAAILIGPEGDFSPEEVALAKQHGIRTARLGRLVLRSETAAIATLAILQHALRNL